jgi:hypothetical protein
VGPEPPPDAGVDVDMWAPRGGGPAGHAREDQRWKEAAAAARAVVWRRGEEELRLLFASEAKSWLP